MTTSILQEAEKYINIRSSIIEAPEEYEIKRFAHQLDKDYVLVEKEKLDPPQATHEHIFIPPEVEKKRCNNCITTTSAKEYDNCDCQKPTPPQGEKEYSCKPCLAEKPRWICTCGSDCPCPNPKWWNAKPMKPKQDTNTPCKHEWIKGYCCKKCQIASYLTYSEPQPTELPELPPTELPLVKDVVDKICTQPCGHIDCNMGRIICYLRASKHD